MRNLIFIFFLTACSGLIDWQGALNNSEKVGQALSTSSVELCAVAESMALHAKNPLETVDRIRVKCDALFSLLETVGALQSAAQAALDIEDTESAKNALGQIERLLPQIRKLIGEISKSW